MPASSSGPPFPPFEKLQIQVSPAYLHAFFGKQASNGRPVCEVYLLTGPAIFSECWEALSKGSVERLSLLRSLRYSLAEASADEFVTSGEEERESMFLSEHAV